MSFLTEMETVISDVRNVYDLIELSFFVQGCIKQLDEWLDDYGKVFFFVVSTTVNLQNEKKKLVLILFIDGKS